MSESLQVVCFIASVAEAPNEGPQEYETHESLGGCVTVDEMTPATESIVGQTTLVWLEGAGWPIGTCAEIDPGERLQYNTSSGLVTLRGGLLPGLNSEDRGGTCLKSARKE